MSVSGEKRGKMIEQIIANGEMLAIIVYRDFSEEGIQYFTKGEFSQQLAHMQHLKGKIIAPHVHNPVSRNVQYTQEALFIRKGKLRVDFYDNQQCYIKSRILGAGDVIFLAAGGHGFEVLEDIQMIEVKQGPYAGEMDKTRFSGICSSEVRLGD